MDSIDLSPQQLAFVAAWNARNEPKPELTLADLDAQQDYELLHELVRAACASYCTRISFHDDSIKYGERRLEYKVTVPIRNGQVTGSENDPQPGTEEWQEIIFVKVKATTTLSHLAGRFASEINGIDGNLLAH